jgi:hypothetical protein
VRRALAISLLLLFSFSLMAPVVSTDAAEARLPACCRRGGKHHCAMFSMGLQQGRSVSIIAEKCPYAPAALTASHLSVFAPPANDAVFAGLISHPAVHAQTAARYRISFDRSRQKRGPPSLSLL